MTTGSEDCKGQSSLRLMGSITLIRARARRETGAFAGETVDTGGKLKRTVALGSMDLIKRSVLIIIECLSLHNPLSQTHPEWESDQTTPVLFGVSLGGKHIIHTHIHVTKAPDGHHDAGAQETYNL